MLKYIDFLNESVGKTKINYYYSESFKNILKSIIISNSPAKAMAQTILNCENNSGITTDITFIDITKRNDMISFIQVNRAIRMYDTTSKEESIENWIESQRKNKNSDIWSKQRSELSIGRFSRKISNALPGLKITDDRLEIFVNHYKSNFDFIKNGNSKFSLIKGEEIKHWYLENNYETITGQLGNSCMRKLSCQRYFDIYTKNPNQVSLLILKGEDESKIIGRALIWTSTENKIIMDRVYTIKDSDYVLFKNYAIQNSWASGTDFTYTELLNTKIKLENWIFDTYPYMDTFMCLNYESGILSPNEDNWPQDGWWKLQETNGEHTEDNVVWSDYHDQYISQDDAVLCGNGDWVYSDQAVYLEYKDRYASPDEETKYSSYDRNYYYPQDVFQSDFLDSVIYEDDAISIVINSNGDEDFIHTDYKNMIVDIIIDNMKYETLSIFTILNPLDDKYYLSDTKVNDDLLINIINKKSEKSSISELEDYILNSNFSIENHIHKFNTLTDKDYKLHFIHYSFGKRKYEMINNMIKALVFLFPTNQEIKNGIQSEAYNIEFLKKRPDIVTNYLDPEILKHINNSWKHSLLPLLIKLSQNFIYDILKDKKMLSAWYNMKY